MIYGWGTDTRTKQVDPATVAVCRFKYVSLAFIFSAVWKREWFLQGRDRAMDRQVSPQEIEALYGPGSVPTPGLWKRLGLPIIASGFLATILLASALGAVLGALGLRDSDERVAANTPVAVYEPELQSDEVAASLEDQTANGATAPPSDVEADAVASEASQPLSSDTADSPATGMDSEVAAIGTAQLTSDGQLISTDIGDDEYGELTVHNVYTTNRVDYTQQVASGANTRPHIAEAGNKIAVINVQLIAESDLGNFFDTALRILDANGRIYSPLDTINIGIWAGSVFNQEVYFEIPADLMSFEFQGGSLDGDRNGYQAEWQVDLTAGDITPYLPDRGVPTEGPVGYTLATDTNVGLLDLRNRNLPSGSLDILDAEVVSKVDGVAPDLGHMWLVIDAQIIGVNRGNFSNETLRVWANGEAFPAFDEINTVLLPGESWNGPIFFEIPVTATDAVLEMGTPNHWPGGQRVQYQLSLP